MKKILLLISWSAFTIGCDDPNMGNLVNCVFNDTHFKHLVDLSAADAAKNASAAEKFILGSQLTAEEKEKRRQYVMAWAGKTVTDWRSQTPDPNVGFFDGVNKRREPGLLSKFLVSLVHETMVEAKNLAISGVCAAGTSAFTYITATASTPSSMPTPVYATDNDINEDDPTSLINNLSVQQLKSFAKKERREGNGEMFWQNKYLEKLAQEEDTE